MGEIKQFRCGMCLGKGKDKDIVRTRKGLRDHLREEHRIMFNLANSPTPDSKKKGSGRQFSPSDRTKQNWWIAEESK